MRYMMILLWVLLSLPLALIAADDNYTLQSELSGQAGVGFELWKIDDAQITAFALPMTILYPFDDQTRLYMTTSPALSSYDAGSVNHLNGLSDIKLGGHRLVFDNEVLLTFGLNLPFGKNRLEVDEYAVASKISLPVLAFRVPNLGQGLDYHLGANSAWTMGSFIMGYGVSYLRKGMFEPFQWHVRDYDPGDEVTFTLGIQKKDFTFLGKRMDLRSDILYTAYTYDYWGQDKVYKSGNRVLIQMMSTFKARGKRTIFLMRGRLKGKNRRSSGDIFEEERKNSNNNQFELKTYHYLKDQSARRYKAIVDFKYFMNNEFDIGGALLFGVGGAWFYQYTNQISLHGDARIYFGSLKANTGNVGAFGISLFGGIQYTL